MHSAKHKLGTWTEEEDHLLAQWQAEYGNRWAEVAKHIRSKTGQQCAQRWRHRVNPNISREKWTEEEDQRLEELVKEHGHSWAEIARNLPGRTDQQCMGRWRRHVDPSLRRDEWDPEEDDLLADLVQDYGSAWSDISKYMDGRSAHQCRLRWCQLSGAEQSSKISRSAAKSVSKSTSKAARSSSSMRGTAGHGTAAHHQHSTLAKRLEYADPAAASGPAAGLAAGGTAQASGCSLRRLSVSGATPGFGREGSAAWAGEALTATRTQRPSRSARSSRAVRRLSTTSEVCSGAMEEDSTDHEDGDEPSAFTLRKTTARTAAKAAVAAGTDAITGAPLTEVPDLAGPTAPGGATPASMQHPLARAPGAAQQAAGEGAPQSPTPVPQAAAQEVCDGRACGPVQQCSSQHPSCQPGHAVAAAEQPCDSHLAPCPAEPAQQAAITTQATTRSEAPIPQGNSPSAAAAPAEAAAALVASPPAMASPPPHLVAKGGLGVATAQPTLPAKRPRGRPWLLVRPLELPGAAPGQLRPGQAAQPQEDEEEESPALTQTLGPSLDLISPSRTLSHAPLPQPPTYTPPSSVRKRALPASRIATFGPRLPPLAIPGEDAAAGTTPARAHEGAYIGDVTPMRTTGFSAKGSQQEEVTWALTPNVLTLLQSPQPRSGGGMDPLLSPEFGGLLTPEWAKRDRSQPPATGGWSSGRSRARNLGEPAGSRRQDLASSLDMALFGSSPKKAKVEAAGPLAPALAAPVATSIDGPSGSSASWLSLGNRAGPGAGIAATATMIAATAGCPTRGEEGTLVGSLGNAPGGNPSAVATASHHLLLPGSAGRSALAAALGRGLGLASTAKTGPPPASGLSLMGGGRTLTGMKAPPPPTEAASSAPLTSASVRVQLRTLLESL